MNKFCKISINKKTHSTIGCFVSNKFDTCYNTFVTLITIFTFMFNALHFDLTAFHSFPISVGNNSGCDVEKQKSIFIVRLSKHVSYLWWTIILCDFISPIGMCTPNACQNNGVCSVTPAGAPYCACLEGFEGDYCQIISRKWWYRTRFIIYFNMLFINSLKLIKNKNDQEHRLCLIWHAHIDLCL